MATLQTACAILILVSAVGCCKPASEYKILSDKQKQARKQTLVVALGGYNGVSPTDTVEIHSVAANSHRNGVSMPDKRKGFGSLIFNNTIYVVGGANEKGEPFFTNTFWSYNITQNKWNTDLPNVPSAVFGSAAVEVGGRMYVLGGRTYSRQQDVLLKHVYAYETRLRKWYTLDTLIPQASGFPCAVAQEQHVYYMAEGSLYRSDNGAKTWKKLSSPSESRTDAACVAVGTDAILLAGGANNAGGGFSDVLNSVEIYNITTNQWKTAAPMKSYRLGGSAELMLPSTENVLICGGFSPDSVDESENDCEVYDWQNDKWSPADFQMNEGRYYFGLFVTQAKL